MANVTDGQTHPSDALPPPNGAAVSPELGASMLNLPEAMGILQKGFQKYDAQNDRGNAASGATTETVSDDKNLPGSLDLTDPYGNVTVLKPDGTGMTLAKGAKTSDAVIKTDATFNWKVNSPTQVEMDYAQGDKATFNADGTENWQIPQQNLKRGK